MCDTGSRLYPRDHWDLLHLFNLVGPFLFRVFLRLKVKGRGTFSGQGCVTLNLSKVSKLFEETTRDSVPVPEHPYKGLWTNKSDSHLYAGGRRRSGRLRRTLLLLTRWTERYIDHWNENLLSFLFVTCVGRGSKLLSLLVLVKPSIILWSNGNTVEKCHPRSSGLTDDFQPLLLSSSCNDNPRCTLIFGSVGHRIRHKVTNGNK